MKGTGAGSPPGTGSQGQQCIDGPAVFLNLTVHAKRDELVRRIGLIGDSIQTHLGKSHGSKNSAHPRWQGQQPRNADPGSQQSVVHKAMQLGSNGPGNKGLFPRGHKNNGAVAKLGQ